MFILDQRLKNDTVCLGQFPLSLLLMSRDANYPWCILVPRREGVRELYELSDEDMAQLVRESRHLSVVLMTLFQGDKLNVAALGNMVPQLHLHHVVRHRGDAAWPGAIWGAVPAVEFLAGGLVARARDIQGRLAEGFVPDSISD